LPSVGFATDSTADDRNVRHAAPRIVGRAFQPDSDGFSWSRRREAARDEVAPVGLESPTYDGSPGSPTADRVESWALRSVANPAEGKLAACPTGTAIGLPAAISRFEPNVDARHGHFVPDISDLS
jgi:hypothetical protein